MEHRQLRNEPFAVAGKWGFRISTCSPSSMYNLSPQGSGGLPLKCHDSICLFCLHEFGHTKHKDETEHTLIWLTNGPSLKATQPSVSLAQGQCFAYCCRKSWKLVAGPCLRNFMEKRQLQNELLDVALLFSRAKIILFSTEFGSLTAVKQLLTDGPSIKSWQHPRNDDSFGNNERLEIQNWNPFANARKGAHTLMPSINERSAIQAMPL